MPSGQWHKKYLSKYTFKILSELKYEIKSKNTKAIFNNDK